MKQPFATLTTLVMLLIACSVSAQKKVQSFTVTETIAISAKQAWAVVGDDFGAIANSHPQIASSEYLGGAITGAEGVKRKCNFNEKGSKYVEEEISKYDPDNYTMEITMYHANGLPLDPEYSGAVYTIKPIDENSCQFVFEMQFRTKPAFMGGMAKGKFKKTIADYAIAIEHHAATGENVNKDNFKQIKKQRRG